MKAKKSAGQKKLIGLGLDSATLSILSPLVEKGYLPTFKKIMEEGIYGALESTVPPITPCAWETAVTGVNAGKHNIFDFFSYTSDYGVEVLNSTDRSSLAVWDFLGFAKKKTIVFNYPMGYPPKKIEGIFVSGMNTPGVNTNFTYPASIKKEILQVAPSYKIDVLGDHIINGKEDLYFDDIVRLTLDHAKAVKYLLRKYPWDLSLIFLTQLDRVHHYFYHHIDKSHPLYDNKKKKNRIEEYYVVLDKILEDLLKSFRNFSFFIFSDHGTEALYNDVFIEKYLEEWKLLSFKKNYAGYLTKYFTESILIGRKLAYKLGLAQYVQRILPGNIFTFLAQTSGIEGKELHIEWSNTKVYFPTPSSQGLRVNLVGREEKGAVKEKDYNKIRNYVINKLLNLKDPNTGEKIIKRVYRREEIYSGPYVENAQDLIVETKSGYHLQKGIKKGKIGLASEGGVPKSAEHGRDGMFIYYHDKLKKRNSKVEKMQILDIAPSLLYILGLPAPKTMEGKIRKDIFDR
ncbi:MAG: alkaline phosphatase family protein [Candidatus Levybacteria bacterium]|nr:alkaline phosphatase family protein [Candidatus Levybacteria bacterium]